MELLSGALVFIFGTLIGSFLNVVVLRHNTNLGLGGRSKCFSCGMHLSWADLVPVLSFVFLRGKCRHCKAAISYQYPLVEAITGAVFWILAQNFVILDFVSLPYLLVAWLCASLFIVISVYDLRHKIIPDVFVGFLILIGFLHAMFFDDTWASIMTGIMIALFFAAIWYMTKGKGMGFGDVKLALAIGWLLYPPYAVSAIAFAFWTGAAVGIALLASKHTRATLKTELPFGPFLALGTLISYGFGYIIF